MIFHVYSSLHVFEYVPEQNLGTTLHKITVTIRWTKTATYRGFSPHSAVKNKGPDTLVGTVLV